MTFCYLSYLLKNLKNGEPEITVSNSLNEWQKLLLTYLFIVYKDCSLIRKSQETLHNVIIKKYTFKSLHLHNCKELNALKILKEDQYHIIDYYSSI